MVTSGVVHTTFLVHTVCSLPEMYEWYMKAMGVAEENSHTTAIHLMTFLVWFIGLSAESVILAFADRRPEEELVKSDRSPELHCSFLNRMVLWWFNPLPILGSRKNLDVEDLFELNHRMTSAYLVPLWEQHWKPTMESECGGEVHTIRLTR